MQKIYLVYSIWDAAYWSTAYFLQSARQEFSKINLTYNPYFLPISQVWGHDAITQQLKCYWFGMRSRAGADYLHAVDAIVTSHLQQLDADAASGTYSLFAAPPILTVCLCFLAGWRCFRI